METIAEDTSLTSTEASHYTLTEAMEKLKVSKPTIYKWAKNGRINFITMSNGFKRYDVDGFIKNPGKPGLPGKPKEESKSTTGEQTTTVNTFIVEDENTGQLVFKSDLTDSKELRIFGTFEEPLFVAKDVAEMLGYKDTKKAIDDHVDTDDKLTYQQSKVNKGGVSPPLFTLQDNTILITESGLYSLILRSKLKSAKDFKRWITKEVLPSIRKKGEYVIEDYKKKLEEKEKRVKYLENKYLHHLPRVQYPVAFVVYMITSAENKKNRTYIMGKTTNLTTRLSTYNKTCEHEVVYYRECISETIMIFAESNLFLRLDEYREKLSCERFILPVDKDVSFFISEIDSTVDFFKNVKADARAILRDDQIPECEKSTVHSPEVLTTTTKKKKVQQKIHRVNHSELYKKYRREYYLKNKGRINQKNKNYRYRNLQRVKNIEKTSRVKNKLKEQARKKLYRVKNKEKLQQYLLKNKGKLKENARQNYLKKYREENKEKLTTKKAKKVLCECGTEHTKSSLLNHQASKKHIDLEILDRLLVRNKKVKEKVRDKECAKSKRSEKIKCECGKEIARGSLGRHKKTQEHKNNI
jgi:excisionase family DNA binding protein